jgi:hypothetical protein
MRRVALGSKPRLGVAVAVLLLMAGGVVAVASQGENDQVSVHSVQEESASLEGLGGDSDVVDAAGVSSARAMVSAGGGSGGGGAASQRAASPTADRSLPQAAPNDPNGPRIVKRADIRVEVKEDGFRAAFQRASAVATAHGGFVAESSSQTDEGNATKSASGMLVLRVPASAFDAARSDLAKLGDVAGEVIGGEDVGGQLVDLEARIRSLQVEEETLRALMVKAKTVGETIEVQQQLTRVRQEIETATGQRARLQDSVALGTIRVNLFEPGAQPTSPRDPDPVAEGFRDAVDASLAVIGGTLIVIGAVLPLALLALLGWALWRVATRRRPAEPAVTA